MHIAPSADGYAAWGPGAGHRDRCSPFADRVNIRGVDVVDHEPAGWFLLRDGDRLFLDVNCNDGAVGYSWLIELDPSERRDYDDEGRASLHRLARAIQDSAPGARDSTSVYRDRDLTDTRGQEVLDAVVRWRDGTEGE